MDFSVLGMYNKWWQGGISIDVLEKELIGKYEAATFKRVYEKFFDYKTNGLYVLRGPRQIGKSTLIKYTIFDLLKKGKNRRAIFYFPLDTVKDYVELRDTLLSYLQFAATEKKQKKVYFYDNFVLKNLERKFGIVQKKSAVVESVVAQNLVFKFSDWLEEGLSNLQNVGYWYSSNGREITLFKENS